MPRSIVLVLCCALMLQLAPAAQTTAPGKTEKQVQRSDEGRPAPAADPAELADLRRDLQRMRSILSQMQTNLGYVSTTTQPLRHQFELEIDMWQVELGRLERHIQRLEALSRR